MVQDAGSTDWWKLTPDASGSYLNGTWTQLASPPDSYSPLYFSSAVLPDGRVIVEGGEYQAYNPAWSTQGAIYDPRLDQWTAVAPPAGWQSIGDAQSVVLADGRYMQADCCSTNAAILDPRKLTWTPIGTGKADINDEEGWTLLPSGKVLAIDANNTASLTNSEIFSPVSGAWRSAGSTIAQLADLDPDGDGSRELGPVLLRPDGTVFAAGATGHSAVYHTSTGKWTVGPDFPVIPGMGQLDVADGPAALLPNGHVLVSASPGIYNAPLYMFEFDGKSLTQVTPPPGGVYDSSYNTNLLVLPTGELLFTDMSNDVEIYTSGTHAPRAWAPEIDGGCGLDHPRAGRHVPHLGHAAQRALVGDVVRRRRPVGDQLPARPDHAPRERRRDVRAHARSQQHVGRPRQLEPHVLRRAGGDPRGPERALRRGQRHRVGPDPRRRRRLQVAVVRR